MSVLINNNDVMIHQFQSVTDKLPTAVYDLKYDPRKGFYLDKTNDFIIPKKIYGDVTIIDKFLKYYNHTNDCMGILLNGLKGSGKTILAQKFCIDSGKPIIKISDSFSGTDFVSFITQKEFDGAIIYLDEFEKTFKSGKKDNIFSEESNAGQDSGATMLSLFDGSHGIKLAFLLTVNDINELSEFLFNRLGRIRYRLDFDGISREDTMDVVTDLLINKTYTKDLLDSISTIGMCTYDILINIIREVNFFDEKPSDCIKRMNVSESKVNLKFSLKLPQINATLAYKATDVLLSELVNNHEITFNLDRYESSIVSGMDYTNLNMLVNENPTLIYNRHYISKHNLNIDIKGDSIGFANILEDFDEISEISKGAIIEVIKEKPVIFNVTNAYQV